MNYVTHPRALTHIQSWYEGTALSEEHPDPLYLRRAFPGC
jgi:hypothetical protein